MVMNEWAADLPSSIKKPTTRVPFMATVAWDGATTMRDAVRLGA
jgi:hypothetical protein